MTEKVLFLVFAFLAVAGALGAITRRNIVHGLLLLVFTFLNVAAIFLVTQAYFLAAIQVLVYAGAIMVLFIFVITLLNLRTFPQERQFHKRQWGVALALSVLVLVEFVAVLASTNFVSAHRGFTPAAIGQAGGNSRVFGETLFNNMLLPFEVASAVLLVAMVGAIVLVKREKTAGAVTRHWEPGEEPAPDALEEEV
ncbi:MAG: NADH-quinone oxidoreductase subunit J [Thermoleophilia bacterium]|nr:NADH-quinone oxidoreductase subunit J [Thermoleophilia bacterium]